MELCRIYHQGENGVAGISKGQNSNPVADVHNCRLISGLGSEGRYKIVSSCYVRSAIPDFRCPGS